MVILAIKSYFSSGTDNFNLGCKTYIYYFFSFFFRKMIKVLCTIFAVIIKNLEMHLNNLNLPMGNSTIYFGFLIQKRDIGKQTTSAITVLPLLPLSIYFSLYYLYITNPNWVSMIT